MARVSSLIALAAFLATAAFGDNVTFLRIDPPVLKQKLKNAPVDAQQRATRLRHQFVEAGCAREEMQEQAVPGQALPNIICILPGSEIGTIVLGAPLDFDSRGDEGSVGWATVSLLPTLVESIKSAPRRHTYVFVAFAGDGGLAGSAFFLKQLSEGQKSEVRGMLALDHLGRTSPQYVALRNDDTMATVLPASARALQLPHMPGAASGVPPSAAQPFERAHVPAITVYSPAVETSTPDSARVSANDIAPDLRRAGLHEAASSQGFALKTGVDLSAYNETYNLLCVYLLFLDRGLGASKRPVTEVARASSPAPESTSAAGTKPELAVAGAAPVADASLSRVNSESAIGPAAPVVARSVTPAATGPTQAAHGPVFQANARLVQVDVVVTDRQGRPARALKQSDFTVLEDGKPQPIRAFEVHQGLASNKPSPRPASPAVTATASQGAPKEYSNFPKEDSASNWTVVLFDILNTPTADQAYARKQLMELVKSIPAGQPTALFVLTQQLQMAQNFTQDPAQLQRIVQQLTPTRSQILTTHTEIERTTNDVQSAALQAQPTAAAQGTSISTDSMSLSMTSRILQGYRDHEAFRLGDRVLFTLDAMKGLARAVSGYPGRKNLLWLSGSFPVQINPDPYAQEEFRNERGFLKEIGTASALLATSRVAVYPVDVRGLQSRGIDISISTAENNMMSNPLPSESKTGMTASSPSMLGSTLSDQAALAADERTTMKKIAEQTGGEAFVNTNDLRRAMERSLEDGTSYYTIAYTPPNDDTVGGYHRIEVKLDQPGSKLSYRRGYYLVPLTSNTAQGAAALRSALQPGMPPATMLYLTASVEPPDGTRKEARIHYLISADGITFADAPGDKKHASIDCITVAFDREGHEVGHASDTLDATFPASAYEQILKYGLPAQQEISLSPGLYNLKVGVMDRATQRMGTVDLPLSIPDRAVALN